MNDPTPVPAPLVAREQNQFLHSLMLQLNESQWWSEEQLAEGQMQQLRKLLAYSRENSPFYRERLANLDIDTMGWDDFRSLPLLTRSDLQQASENIDCESLPENHGGTQEILTSGSTATPVRLRGTGLTGVIWNAINMREQLWHQREPDKIMSAIRWHPDAVALPPLGTSFPDWGYPTNQFYQTGPGYVLNSSAAIADQLKWLAQIRPHYLMTHPSNLKSLLRNAHGDDPAFSRLLQVRTVGEQVDEPLRTATKEELNIPLVDFYSSQEMGYIALQCPDHDHYHVQAESLIVEVLDETGAPSKVGEPGRVVVTSLRNFATPLIRYEIGDFAVRGEACDCGRGLPVLTRVSGRVRNMLRMPDGQVHWPNFGFRYMMDVAPIRQFQVVQLDLDKIELRLVVIEPLSEEQEAQLSSILAKHLGYPFAINISYHESLPRGAGGKFEDFLSLIDIGTPGK